MQNCPLPQVDGCTWTHCINPVSRLYMSNDYASGTLTDFDAIINYSCVGEDVFFDHDPSLEQLQVQCTPDGSYAYPDPWPKCVSCEHHATLIVQKRPLIPQFQP